MQPAKPSSSPQGGSSPAGTPPSPPKTDLQTALESIEGKVDRLLAEDSQHQNKLWEIKNNLRALRGVPQLYSRKERCSGKPDRA